MRWRGDHCMCWALAGVRIDDTQCMQVRASINAVTWTPEGRRCLTGTQAGEFTLWHGQHFGFETILQVGFLML